MKSRNRCKWWWVSHWSMEVRMWKEMFRSEYNECQRFVKSDSCSNPFQDQNEFTELNDFEIHIWISICWIVINERLLRWWSKWSVRVDWFLEVCVEEEERDLAPYKFQFLWRVIEFLLDYNTTKQLMNVTLSQKKFQTKNTIT